MRRQHRILAFGLSACLMSGCLRAFVAQPETVPTPVLPPNPADNPLPAAAPAAPVSDYQAQTVLPVAQEVRPPEEAPVHVAPELKPVPPVVRPPDKPPDKPPDAPRDKPPAAGAQPEPTPAAPGPVPDAPLVAALRCILDKRPPAEAIRLLERYDRPSQEVLLALLQVAAPLGEGELNRASPQKMAAVLDQLNALAQTLRARAPLALDKVCFCSRIVNFGVYQPLPPDYKFQAGVNGRPGEHVHVYAEVRNFVSVPRGPCFETTLTGRLEVLGFDGKEIHGLDGKPVAPPIDVSSTDRNQTLRQDYFVEFGFNVPANLPTGDYILRIQVRDANGPPGVEPAGPRVAWCSLDFKVVGGVPHVQPTETAP